MKEQILLPNVNDFNKKIDGICWSLSKLKQGNFASVDLSKIPFFRPQGAIMLLLICKRIWELTGNAVELVNIAPAVHSYLERVNYFEAPFVHTNIRLSPWDKLNRMINSPTVMEINHVSAPMDSANIGIKVKSIIENWFPDRKDTNFSSKVSTMVAEICNNSLEHSMGYSKMGDCYCMLQKYTIAGKPEIAIAIGDIGIGIRQHLKHKYEWIQDSDVYSIKKVLTGVSGRQDDSGGMGILFIKRTISSNNGVFIIRSGKGLVEVSKSIKSIEFQNSFPGTQTLLVLN